MESKPSGDTENAAADIEADKLNPVNEESEIEQILNDLGGSFGRYQILNYTLFSIPMIVIGIASLSYVFTTLNLEYR